MLTGVVTETCQAEFGKASGGQEYTSCFQDGLENAGAEKIINQVLCLIIASALRGLGGVL